MVQVAQHLPSTCKDLGSIPSIATTTTKTKTTTVSSEKRTNEKMEKNN
jgi:hypothetical protein